MGWLRIERRALDSPLSRQAIVNVEATGISFSERRCVVREIAPEAVDAVFDHVGGKSVSTSYHMLNARGTLVCYAIASALDNSGSMLQQ